jgi:hypothetical protein
VRRCVMMVNALIVAAILWQAAALAAWAIPHCSGYPTYGCNENQATQVDMFHCCNTPLAAFCCQYHCFNIWCYSSLGVWQFAGTNRVYVSGPDVADCADPPGDCIL